MKTKHLIMVSVLLAILTIGAVSASDDVSDVMAANGDSGDEISPADDEKAVPNSGDDRLSAEDEEALEDLGPGDFQVDMVTDEIDLDDEDNSNKTIFSFYNPNGTEEYDYIYVSYKDSEGYAQESSYLYFNPDDVWTYRNITFGDLHIYMMGSYDLKVYYSYYDDVNEGSVNLKIGSGTLNVTKTLSPSDFAYSIEKDYNRWDETDEFVFDLWSIPCEGTLMIDVNGTQRYCSFLNYSFFEEIVDVPDLDITKYGNYEILAKFRPVIGEVINITSFNLTYYYQNEGDEGDNGVVVSEYVDITNSESRLGSVQDYMDVVSGTITVYVNSKQVYAKTFASADDKSRVYLTVADLKLASYAKGRYKVNITYKKANGDVVSTEKFVNFTVVPKVTWTREMTVGENAGLIISGPKGISGSATLYNAVLNQSKYKKGSVFATVSIVDGYARISFAQLAEGLHRFYLDYTFGNYVCVSGSDEWNTVNVYKKDTRFNSTISASSIVAGGNVVVSLAGPTSDYDIVYINVDGETVRKISSFTGSIKETVSGLAAGTHYVTVMLSGDSFYSNTFEVKVNSPAPAPAKKADKVKLTLKKVKVKRSAKKLTLKATLKINGKAAKGKTIKFKFNKKSYKVKTNKKGIAKLTIKKKVLKKLKVGKKVTYRATYGKVTKKYTVKVKK